MNKLINYYVKLYIGEDSEHEKERVETKRFWYLVWHLICTLILVSGFLTTFFKALGKILGVLN